MGNNAVPGSCPGKRRRLGPSPPLVQDQGPEGGPGGRADDAPAIPVRVVLGRAEATRLYTLVAERGETGIPLTRLYGDFEERRDWPEAAPGFNDLVDALVDSGWVDFRQDRVLGPVAVAPRRPAVPGFVHAVERCAECGGCEACPE